GGRWRRGNGNRFRQLGRDTKRVQRRAADQAAQVLKNLGRIDAGRGPHSLGRGRGQLGGREHIGSLPGRGRRHARAARLRNASTGRGGRRQRANTATAALTLRGVAQ